MHLYLFYFVLVVHLLAVVFKLALLFYIPRLRDTEHVRKFLSFYQSYDSLSNYFLWGSGALLILVTSPKYLLQPWLLLSMVLYLGIFIIIKKVLLGGMQRIATSQKPFAHQEIQKLRFENLCVIITSLSILGAIGFLMVTKPFAY